MKQRGFTLMELLVVIGIIGILASMGVMNFHLLRSRAYAAHIDSEMHDLQTSLEASRIQLAGGGGFYGGWTMSSGPIHSWTGVDFLPGFINRDGISVFAWYDASCDGGTSGPWCLVSGASISSCKSGKSKSSWTLNDGRSIEWNWQGNPWC